MDNHLRLLKLETNLVQQGEHDDKGCYQQQKDEEGPEFMSVDFDQRHYGGSDDVCGGCDSGGNMGEDCGSGGYNRLQFDRDFPGRRKRKKIDYEPIESSDTWPVRKEIEFARDRVQNDDEKIEYAIDRVQNDDEEYGKCLGRGKGWGMGRRKMKLGVDMQVVKQRIKDNGNINEYTFATITEEESEDDFESCDSDEESTADYFDAIEILETEAKEELLKKPKPSPPRQPGCASTRLLIHRSAESRSCLPVDTAQQLGGIRRGILRLVEERNWTESTLIQSMMWPAVARGYSVVGVAGEDAGKTVGWLLPLVNQLTDWANYRKLPPGGGPKLVVLAAGRKTVKEVKGMIDDFIWQSNINFEVSEAYAGIEEDEKFKLINGVDILVTTPNCLIRLMDERITNFNRCCHLILEEGDKLVEWFPSQMKKVMEAWRSVKHQFVGLPHQTVLVAQQFTEKIKDFAEEFMEREVLIVFDDLEKAAIYGSLKVSPHLISYEDKLEKIVNLVETKDLRRVAICCTKNDVGIQIVEHLKRFDVQIIFLHEKLNDDEYEDAFDSLIVNDDAPLIVTDEASLKITHLVPAHLLIHWDLPLDRKKFALRFMWLKPAMKPFHENPALLAYDYYNDFAPECQMLVSKNDDLDYVMDFLERISAVIPEELVLHHRDVTETSCNLNQEQLCEQIVSFGICREEVLGRCKGRHHLDWELDNPYEDCGTVVQFEVIKVESPVQYKVKMKGTEVVRTVVVAGLVPSDGDIDWDDKVTELVADKLTNIDNAKKVVTRGKVLLAVGNILFLKQCQALNFLPETKTFVEYFETRSNLISSGHALDNSAHMEALLALVDSLKAPLCRKNVNKEESNVEGNDNITNAHSQQDGNARNPDEESLEGTSLVRDDNVDGKVGSLNKNKNKKELLASCRLANIDEGLTNVSEENGEDLRKLFEEEVDNLRILSEEEGEKLENLSEEDGEDMRNLSVEDGEDLGKLYEEDGENFSKLYEEDGENLRQLSEEDLEYLSEKDEMYYFDDQDQSFENEIMKYLRDTLRGKIDIKMETTPSDNDASMFFPSSTSVPCTSISLPPSAPVTDNLKYPTLSARVSDNSLSLPPSTPVLSSVMQTPLGMPSPHMVEQMPSDMSRPVMVEQLPSGMSSPAMVEQVSSENRKQLPIVWYQNEERIMVKVTPAAVDLSIPRDLTLDQVFVSVEQQHINVQVLEIFVTDGREEFILHTTGRLETFGRLDASEANVKVNGRMLEIQLCSKENEKWMRLTKEKFGFVKVDLDKCQEDNDENEVKELEWGDHFDKEVGVECGAADGYFATKPGDRFSWENGERVLPVEDLNWKSNDTNKLNNFEELLLEDVIIDIAEGAIIETVETPDVYAPTLEDYFDGSLD